QRAPGPRWTPREVPPLLEVRDLDVGYGDVPVLFGVDVDVAPGEVVALLGTNGAGKSTLLRAISGLLTPTRGTIRLAEQELTRLPAHQGAAAGVVQMPGGHGVFPSLTVDENLRMAAWLVPDGSRRAHVLDLFPVLAQRLDARAADLSGGQQQMLSLAM